MKRIVLAAAVASLLGACASMNSTPAASALMAPRSGSAASGTVTFSETTGGVRLEARLAGLTPGEHGFHIHEAGDCSAADAASAKGHYNPTGRTHGHHAQGEHHSGDMPNLVANAQGDAHLTVDLKGVTLAEITGRSVIVHADPDDYKSQPAGNAGKRIACGVIVAR